MASDEKSTVECGHTLSYGRETKLGRYKKFQLMGVLLLSGFWVSVSFAADTAPGPIDLPGVGVPDTVRMSATIVRSSSGAVAEDLRRKKIEREKAVTRFVQKSGERAVTVDTSIEPPGGTEFLASTKQGWQTLGQNLYVQSSPGMSLWGQLNSVAAKKKTNFNSAYLGTGEAVYLDGFMFRDRTDDAPSSLIDLARGATSVIDKKEDAGHVKYNFSGAYGAVEVVTDKLNHRIEAFSIVKAPSDTFVGAPLNKYKINEIEGVVRDVVGYRAEVKLSEWKEIGGKWVPFRADAREIYKCKSGEELIEDAAVVRDEYEIDPQKVNDKELSLRLPPDLILHDYSSGLNVKIGESQPKAGFVGPASTGGNDRKGAGDKGDVPMPK